MSGSQNHSIQILPTLLPMELDVIVAGVVTASTGPLAAE